MINVTLKNHDIYLGLASRMGIFEFKKQQLFVEHLIFVSRILGAGDKKIIIMEKYSSSCVIAYIKMQLDAKGSYIIFAV